MIMLNLLILFSLFLRPVSSKAESTGIGEFACQNNGDVYFEPKSTVNSQTSKESAEILHVQSAGGDCELEKETDRDRIHGCQKAQSCPIIMFIKGTKNQLYFVTVSCNHGNSLVQHSSDCSSSWNGEYVGKSRQRRLANGILPLNGTALETTSTVFSVELIFNSNDEISFDCNPDEYGNLYVSNPEPDVLKSVLAFSDIRRKMCHVTILDYGNTVAVGNCDLNTPVIVAFSARKVSKGIIGGTGSFRVYKIDCLREKSPRWSNVNVSVKGGSDVTADVCVLSIVMGLLTALFAQTLN